MNWEKIKAKYPKAVSRFIEWDNLNAETFMRWIFLYNIRDLYDFFDDNNIIVLPDFDYCVESAGWCFIICDSDCIYDYRFDTRAEAETQAFTIAFKTLEDKL